MRCNISVVRNTETLFLLVLALASVGACSDLDSLVAPARDGVQAEFATVSNMASSTADSLTWDANGEIETVDGLGNTTRWVHEETSNGFTAKIHFYRNGNYDGYAVPIYNNDKTAVIEYELYMASTSSGNFTRHDASDDEMTDWSDDFGDGVIDESECDRDIDVGCCDGDATLQSDGPGGDCDTELNLVGTYDMNGMSTDGPDGADCDPDELREEAANATFRAGLGTVIGSVAMVATAFTPAAGYVFGATAMYVGAEIENVDDALDAAEHCEEAHL